MFITGKIGIISLNNHCMKYVITLATLLLSFMGSTQELSEYAPKSPEAAEMQKYGEYPVDLSTGLPNIEIPLYTVQSGGYSLPIKLLYHASGIKVSQEATWVGLGWNLSAGASITLDARDGPDAYNQAFDDMPNATEVKQYMKDHPYGFEHQYIRNVSSESWVKDVYNFSSPTASGKFYFDRSGTDGIVVYPPDAFTVIKGNGVPPMADFIIIDKLGNRYIFAGTREYSSTAQQHSQREHITSWLVDRIETPSNRSINFKYHDNGNFGQYNYGDQISVTTIEDPKAQCKAEAEELSTSFSPLTRSGASYGTRTKKIKEIQFDGGRVVFNIKRDRKDFLVSDLLVAQGIAVKPGYLSSMQVEYIEGSAVTTIKDYTFMHSYFESFDHNESPKKYRLRLDGVLDQIGKQETGFSYSTIALPNKDSKSQDYWGYYNNKSNSDLIPPHIVNYGNLGRIRRLGSADRSVNPSTIEAGILKEITYPTGGTTRFIYEPNTYFGKDFLKKYVQKQGSLVVHGRGNGTFTPIDEDYCINAPEEYQNCPITKSYSYDVHRATAKLTFSIINKNNPPSENKHSYGEVRVNGIRIARSRLSTSNETTITLLGKSALEVEAYGDDIEVSASIEYYEDPSDDLINVTTGGLRIQSIENHDRGRLLLKKEYTYVDPQDPTKSSGVLQKDLQNWYSSSSTVYDPTKCDPITDPGGGKGVLGTSWRASRTNTYSSSSVSGIEGSSVVYKHVTEKVTSANGSNGFSVYTFTTDKDITYDVRGTIRINTNWKRGKLLQRKDYKVIGEQAYLVQKTTNTYTEDPRRTATVRGFKLFEQARFMGVADEQYLENLLSAYEMVDYTMTIPWFYQNSTTNTSYFYDTNQVLKDSLQVQTNYHFDNPDHLQLNRTVVTDSKNNILITHTQYPQDIANRTIAEQGLITQHRIATPIKVVTSEKKGTAPEEVLTTQYTKFKNWDEGIIAPESVQTLKGRTTSVNTLEDRIRYYDYDVKGNPLEVSKEQGGSIVYIWGYQDQYPIAKIQNASYNEVAPYITNLKAISNADTDHCREAICKEELLRVALDNLRSALPNAMVSTYTYDPLIGVTSMTNANGYTMFYEYDSSHRLQYVRDADGKLISENEYHYTN